MPKIIFYSRLADIDHLDGQLLSGHTREEISFLAKEFDKGNTPVLLVNAQMIHSWRTELPYEQVEIEFVGAFTDLEILLALRRTFADSRKSIMERR